MNNNTDKVPAETRETSGCKVHLFFNEERNLEVKFIYLTIYWIPLKREITSVGITLFNQLLSGRTQLFNI